jgi:hypothetical protein
METSTGIIFKTLLSNIGLCFIDYYFKCCMVGQKWTTTLSGETVEKP